MNKRQKYVLSLVAFLIATVAFAAGYERISKDQLMIGTGTSDDKSIEFDTGLSPNAKMTVDGSTGDMGFNKNNFGVGDGSAGIKSFYFDTGASPNDPALGVDASGNVSIDNDASVVLNTDSVDVGDDTDADQTITFKANNGANNATIGWSETDEALVFSNDGTTVRRIGSGGGAGGGINVLQDYNWDFELGDDGNWTKTGASTFTIVTSATHVYNGEKSGLWDASSATEKLQSATITVQAGLDGKLCGIFAPYKGGEDNIKFYAWNGSSVIGEEKYLVESTKWTTAINTFPCPAQGTNLILIFEADSNANPLYLDDIHMGVKDIVTAPDPRWPSYDESEVTITANLSGFSYLANLVPYQTATGEWRLTGNVYASYDATTSKLEMEISGVSWDTGARQALACSTTSGSIYTAQCETVNGSGDNDVYAQPQGGSLSNTLITFNVALASKPTWATKYAPDVYLASAPDLAFNRVSAYASTDQTGLTYGTPAVVEYDTEEWDFGNYFDSTTNYRFQPTKEGYYSIKWGVTIDAGASVGLFRAHSQIHKNGVSVKYGTRFSGDSSADNIMDSYVSVGSVVIHFNGTTDYVDIQAFGATTGGSATWNIEGGEDKSYFFAEPVLSKEYLGSAITGFSIATEDRAGLVPSYKYEELDISSSGDFDAAQPVLRIAKVGSLVTLTWQAMTTTSKIGPASASGFIPTQYRPTETIYSANTASISIVSRITVASDGTFSCNNFNYSGTGVNVAAINGGSISWVVDE